MSAGNFTKVYVWKAFGAVSVSAVGTGGAQPQLCAQLPDCKRGPRLLPQGVSNKRGPFSSLEIKQTQIDDGMAFLEKRGKQFSNVLGEHLCCASEWGWLGEEGSVSMG